MAVWTDKVFQFEQVLKASDLNDMDANFDALAEGAAGAPAIQTTAIAAGAVTDAKIASHPFSQSDIAASAIGQGELKTTTTTESFAAGAGDGASVAIRNTAAGSYGMGFRSRIDIDQLDSGGNEGGTHVGRADVISEWKDTRSANSDTGTGSFVSLYTSNTGSSGTNTTFLEIRYVQASPPYDLGDGECGDFIFADVLNNGFIAGLSIAPDPPWANNGPTDIRPDYIDKKTGKKYKRVRRPSLTRADLDSGRTDMADYIAAQKEAPVEEVEITHAYKNADMDLFPHSWASPPQGTICLLDPVNTHDLLMLHEAGEDVADLIHRGYIQIGDKINRKGPPGVVPVTFKWKKS